MSFFFFLPGSKSPSHKDNTAEIWARLVCEAVPSPPSCREKASTKGTAGAPPARDIAAYLPLSQHELPTDGNPTWRARVWRAHLLVAQGTRGQAAPPAEMMSVQELGAGGGDVLRVGLSARLFPRDKDVPAGSLLGIARQSHFPAPSPFLKQQEREKPIGAILLGPVHRGQAPGTVRHAA